MPTAPHEFYSRRQACPGGAIRVARESLLARKERASVPARDVMPRRVRRRPRRRENNERDESRQESKRCARYAHASAGVPRRTVPSA